MNSQTSKSLTEGSLYRHLCTLALPLILGNILQQFYNTIDAFVIGRFAGTGEFAAIGIAGTVMNLFLFALVGVCTGFSSLPASFICFTVIGNCCFKKRLPASPGQTPGNPAFWLRHSAAPVWPLHRKNAGTGRCQHGRH